MRANKSSLVVLHSEAQIPERFSFSREGTREKERKREVERLRYRFSNVHLTSRSILSSYPRSIFVCSTSEGL